MLLFQKALQVAVTHFAALFTFGGIFLSVFFSGNGLKVIDGRPGTNPWVAGGLLLIEYAVPRIFTGNNNLAVYTGAHAPAPINILRANQSQSLALVWNTAVDAAAFAPAIPSLAALVATSVSSSVSSVNAVLFSSSKGKPNKALLSTGRPRCSASGSKSNRLTMNTNNTVNNVFGESSIFAGQLSAIQSFSMGWKAGHVADALVDKGTTVSIVPSPTALVLATMVSSSTAMLDATHFRLYEPHKALVDTGRPQCAASGLKDMERLVTTNLMGKSSVSGDQCSANQFSALSRRAGYATCSWLIQPATVCPATPTMALPSVSIPSSIPSLDASLFCLRQHFKALSASGRPRCAASGSKKRGQAANGNKGAPRKSSGPGSSGRSSNSGGSSLSGSSGGGSSGGSAPPPPPPPGRSGGGGAPTRCSSRLQNSPAPSYALTTPRPRRRTLKVKQIESPPDPPSDPPPPPSPSEPENHEPFDVGDLHDPYMLWLRKIMILIFCVYVAGNMAPKLARVVPYGLVQAQILALTKRVRELEALVPVLMQRAKDWLWPEGEGVPTPTIALAAHHVPDIYAPEWHSADGGVPSFKFPIFAEGAWLRFAISPDSVVQALVHAGLLDRATRGPLVDARKCLCRVLVAVLGVVAAVQVIDAEWVCAVIEWAVGARRDDDGPRVGVADADCDRPFWLAQGVEYEYADSALDESYLALPEAIVDASPYAAVRAEDLDEEDAEAVCAFIVLAPYLQQQQESAKSGCEERAAAEPLMLTWKEEPSEAIPTEVTETPDPRVDDVLEDSFLEVTIQNPVELPRPTVEVTLEAAIGSPSIVTDLSTPAVESERTEGTSAGASTSSDPRGPGIWSPPVNEINGLTFVVIEGGRRQRKRHRKPKAPANPVAGD